jgi:hypothetical protein
LSRVTRDRIVNIDERNWRSAAGGIWTWAATGSESVPCAADQNEKEGATVIAAIDAAGTRRSLTAIRKRKTPRCLIAFNLPPEIWGVTSPTGWTTTDLMCRDFTILREQLYSTARLVALLGMFSAHRAAGAKALADSLGIQLVLFPPGCPNALQPLGRRVFGVLKVYG